MTPRNLTKPILLLLFATIAAAADLPLRGIAHVAFRATDFAASRSFYTGVLGYEQAFTTVDGAGEPSATYFKINDDQFIKLVLVPAPAPDDRLVEIALQTDDVRALRPMLRRRGLKPSGIERRADGALYVSVRDPDEHVVSFVEYAPESLQAQSRGKNLSARRLSDHLWHAGVSVADEAAAKAFYEEKLGFREIWRGGPAGAPTAWVNVRMPGERGDYVEYMLHAEPPSRDRLSSMHHVCLQAPDMVAAYRAAVNRGVEESDRHQPRIGRIGRWLMNLFDPDGTRAELMEPVAAGTRRAAER